MDKEVIIKQGENEIETAARIGMTVSPVRFASDNGTPFVVTPEGFAVKSLENLCPKPARKRGNIVTTDTDSFCQYVIEHLRVKESTAYADIDVENDAGALVAPEKETRAERNRRMELLASIATAVTIPEESRLWTASDIAQYLSMGKRTVAEKLVFTPGFPAPVDIGSRRWYMRDVIEWARKRKAK